MTFYGGAGASSPSPTATPSKDGAVRLLSNQKWNDDGALTCTAFEVNVVSGTAVVQHSNGQTYTLQAGGYTSVSEIQSNAMKVTAGADSEVYVKFNYL